MIEATATVTGDFVLTGNTYPHRRTLFELGGRWDGSRKAWVFTSAEAYAKAQDAIKARGGNSYQRKAPRAPRVNSYRFGSGAVMYRNAKGRCIDAPCCGCCTF